MIFFYSNTYNGFTAVAFQLSCIGNDPGAARLLIELDQDPDVGEYIDAFLVGSDFERHLEDKWFVVCYNQHFSKLIDMKQKPR